MSRALKIHERDCGADSPEATRDLHNLAGSHEEAGDIEAAAALYERAIELKDRMVGGDQEELAEMQFSVAGLYIEWGNFSRARELLSMCVGTFKRKKGARLAVAYETLAHIEEFSGRYNGCPDRVGAGGENMGIVRAGAYAGIGDEHGISGEFTRSDEKERFGELVAGKGGGGSGGGGGLGLGV